MSFFVMMILGICLILYVLRKKHVSTVALAPGDVPVRLPGSTLLKIASTLYFVLAWIMSPLTVLTFAVDGSFMGVYMLLRTGYHIFIGVMGIWYRDTIEKARFLSVLAGIDMGILTLPLLISLATGAVITDNAGSIPVELILIVYVFPLSILYFVGALRNNRAARRK